MLGKKNDNGEVKPHSAIPVEELRTWFVSFAEDLMRDSYMTMNGFYPTLRRASKKYRPYFLPQRAKLVGWLNCNFVDLDCYKLGIDPGDAVGQILERARTNHLPLPGITAMSGRGAYAIWILGDPDDKNKPPVTHKNWTLWNKIQETICDSLTDLGADYKAKNISGYLRIPGSYNSKTDERVIYSMHSYAGSGGIPVYTLDQLADTFGIPLISSRKARRIGMKSKPRGRTTTLHQGRIKDLYLLNNMRGGFSEGCREIALWYLGTWLLKTGNAPAQVRAKMLEFNETFTPPLKEREVTKAAYPVKLHNFRTSTIVKQLGITRKEAGQLQMLAHKDIRDKRRKARLKQEREERKRVKDTKYQDLKVELLRLHLKSGEEYSLREYAGYFEVSPHTISKLLRKLGLEPNNPPPKRIKPEMPQKQLKFSQNPRT